MDLEAGRKRSGVEDLFISYHAGDDVQSTYAGALFHNGRNYHVSPLKNNVSSKKKGTELHDCEQYHINARRQHLVDTAQIPHY